MVKNNEKKLAIILLGAPGSGKGTQGEILEKNTGFRRYVMSDFIKKELKPGSNLYNKVFKNGELLGDVDIFNIFGKYFKSENQVIIDGIPRTLNQAYWLYGFLMNYYYNIELVFFDVDEKKLLKRIISRRYCPKCHRLYNENTNKPKRKGFCDFDGEKLVQREDDKKDIFSDRLKIFDAVKKVILNVYKGNLIEVNANGTIEEVSQRMIKKIILNDK